MITGSPDHRITGFPDQWITGSPDHWITGSPDHRITGSLDHRIPGSPDLPLTGPLLKFIGVGGSYSIGDHSSAAGYHVASVYFSFQDSVTLDRCSETWRPQQARERDDSCILRSLFVFLMCFHLNNIFYMLLFMLRSLFIT